LRSRGSHFDPDIVDALIQVAGEFASIARNFRDEPDPDEVVA
jgi:response regulator RpfG family c-di-GMP phosphodiesterase